MKIASISGITNYVKSIDGTAKFYSALGFRLGEQNEDSLTVYVNWFWIRFQVTKDSATPSEDRGTYLNLKVVDVDEFYTNVVGRGLKPLTQPEDTSWGSREFMIQDPDGYTLVFFQKQK
jgi:predicted lactoylglutathione lyase